MLVPRILARAREYSDTVQWPVLGERWNGLHPIAITDVAKKSFDSFNNRWKLCFNPHFASERAYGRGNAPTTLSPAWRVIEGNEAGSVRLWLVSEMRGSSRADEADLVLVWGNQWENIRVWCRCRQASCVFLHRSVMRTSNNNNKRDHLDQLMRLVYLRVFVLSLSRWNLRWNSLGCLKMLYVHKLASPVKTNLKRFSFERKDLQIRKWKF